MKFRKHFVALMMTLVATASFAQQITPSSWTIFTKGNSSAATGSNTVNLFDQGVSWSQATANLGNLGKGTINLTFNYSTTSINWWEDPYAAYLTGVAPIYASTSNPNILPNVIANPYTSNATLLSNFTVLEGGNFNGTKSESFAVNGNTELIFGLGPNIYSGFGDHVGTYFNISNLNINYVAAPVPEPETYAMLLAGMGVIAFLRRRKNLSKI